MADATAKQTTRRAGLAAAAVAAAVAGGAIAHSAGAQGGSCEAALTLAAARLAQCRYGAEASFAKTGNEVSRDAAFEACDRQFHQSFERAQETWGDSCPDTVPASTIQDYVAQTSGSTVAATGGGSLAAFPSICQPTPGVTTLKVTNNCPGSVSLTASTVNAGQANPSCLQNIANGSSATAYLQPASTNFSFWTGSYGAATLFEIVVDVSGQDSFDISYNQGFNIGMTLVTPPGTLVPYIVALDSKAPGAYQLPANQPGCATQPCLSPTYNANTGGEFQLFLCNRPTDTADTPGPCGCAPCPCPSPAGPGCNWQTVTCQGLPIPGHNGCPVSCPTPAP